MDNKYETGLFALRPKVWKEIRHEEGASVRTYLIPVDVPNIADHVHVNPHDSKSEGYAGATLNFPLENGEVHVAKGPWHGGTSSLLREVGLDVRDLHATAVTMYAVTYEPYSGKRYVDVGHGRKEYREDTWDVPVRGEILYKEETPVLGMFMRGDRIGHAYANATGKPVWIDVESNGGGSRKMISPGEAMHPMAANYE